MVRLADELLERIRAREGRYDEQAYLLVLASIEYIQVRLPARRHVTGHELAHAVRDFFARPVRADGAGGAAPLDEKSGWIEYDIGPGTLSIGNVAPEWKPSPGGGCAALEVDDFPSAMERLKAAGCPLYGPMESPVCHMVIVSDPDGNSVALHKRKT